MDSETAGRSCLLHLIGERTVPDVSHENFRFSAQGRRCLKQRGGGEPVPRSQRRRRRELSADIESRCCCHMTVSKSIAVIAGTPAFADIATYIQPIVCRGNSGEFARCGKMGSTRRLVVCEPHPFLRWSSTSRHGPTHVGATPDSSIVDALVTWASSVNPGGRSANGVAGSTSLIF
jgi:hypothetical protein